MRSAVTAIVFLAALGLWLATPTAASAKGKSKGKSCAAAEALLLETGQGDRDGDGLSDCRERRQLGTSMHDPDTDDDGLSDLEEIERGCDPLDHDSDHDGIEDGDDDTPEIPEQKLEAFLDALTCPLPGVPGAITALGVTATLDDRSEFEEGTCEELAMHFAEAGSAFVEIEILEDAAGALLATEVELEDESDDDDD